MRKKQWLNLLQRAKDEGYVTLDEISVDTLNSSQKMAYKKKGRNCEFINLNTIFGRGVPKYDVDYISHATWKTAINYIQNRLQQFVGSHKSLWWIIFFLKKNTKNLK